MKIGNSYFIHQGWVLPDTKMLIAQGNIDSVWLKLADGTYSYHATSGQGIVDDFRSNGANVHGWAYSYGNYPEQEARKAAERVRLFGITNLAIDLEKEWYGKSQGVAARYLTTLREELPEDTKIWLCSYRFPSYHPTLPWETLMRGSDGYLPQIYWQSAHNPAEQWERSFVEYRQREIQYNIEPKIFLPAGSAYTEHGWTPTVAEVLEFLNYSIISSENIVKKVGQGVVWWKLRHAYELGFLPILANGEWSDDPIDPPPPPEPTQKIVITFNGTETELEPPFDLTFSIKETN